MQPLEKIDDSPVQDYLNITEETGIEMELALQILSHLDMEARSHLAVTSRSWNVVVVSETDKEELKRVNSFIPALIGQIKGFLIGRGLSPEWEALYDGQIQALETLMNEYNTSKMLSLKALTDKLHTFRDQLIPILKAIYPIDLNRLNFKILRCPMSCERLLDWIKFEYVINTLPYGELIARFVEFHDLSLISRLFAVHEQKFQDIDQQSLGYENLWRAIVDVDIMQKNPEVFRPYTSWVSRQVIEHKMLALINTGDYESAISLAKFTNDLEVEDCITFVKRLLEENLNEKAEQFVLIMKNHKDQGDYVMMLSFLDVPKAMLEAEKLSDPLEKTEVLKDAVDLLREYGQFREAKEVVQKIPDETIRNSYFSGISKQMVRRKQDVNEALKTALLITDELARNRTLDEMCELLERRKEFDAAINVVLNISVEKIQNKRLMSIVGSLISNNDIDKALKVAQIIKPGEERKKCLRAVAEAFKTEGEKMKSKRRAT